MEKMVKCFLHSQKLIPIYNIGQWIHAQRYFLRKTRSLTSSYHRGKGKWLIPNLNAFIIKSLRFFLTSATFSQSNLPLQMGNFLQHKITQCSITLHDLIKSLTRSLLTFKYRLKFYFCNVMLRHVLF